MVEAQILGGPDAAQMGVLAGHNSGWVTGCRVTGVVTGGSRTGGFAGYSEGNVIACQAESTVTGLRGPTE